MLSYGLPQEGMLSLGVDSNNLVSLVHLFVFYVEKTMKLMIMFLYIVSSLINYGDVS